jgi:hypothetical protein
MNRTTLAACAIAGSAMLGFTTAAPAIASHSPSYSYSYTTRATHEQNRASYWGDNCTKYKLWNADDTVYFSHKAYFTKVVVRAGRQNTVFSHFYGKKVWSANGRDIRHVIVCKPSKHYDNSDENNRSEHHSYNNYNFHYGD